MFVTFIYQHTPVHSRALQVSSVSLMGPAYSLDMAPIRPSGSRARAAQSQSQSSAFGGGGGVQMRANSTHSPAKAAGAAAVRKDRSESGTLPIDAEQMHWEVVQRILFLYALLNPGTNYVQVRRDPIRATISSILMFLFSNLLKLFSYVSVHCKIH